MQIRMFSYALHQLQVTNQSIFVTLSLAKEDKINNAYLSNHILVRGGHYNFNTVFSDRGKYLLFLDIEDIYHTNSILNVVFELNADISPVDQFYDLLKAFFINYNYIYIPITVILIFALILKYHKKYKLQNKNGVR